MRDGERSVIKVLMIGTDVCLSMAVMCVASKDGYLMQWMCVDMDEGVREERKVMSKCRGGSI
jgi:hypothetical protein